MKTNFFDLNFFLRFFTDMFGFGYNFDVIKQKNDF